MISIVFMILGFDLWNYLNDRILTYFVWKQNRMGVLQNLIIPAKYCFVYEFTFLSLVNTIDS